MDSILSGCLRCPHCHLLPNLVIDYEDSMPYGLICTGINHKHMAYGYSVPMAIKHWNMYVQFLITKDIDTTGRMYTSHIQQIIFKGLYGIDSREVA